MKAARIAKVPGQPAHWSPSYRKLSSSGRLQCSTESPKCRLAIGPLGLRAFNKDISYNVLVSAHIMDPDRINMNGLIAFDSSQSCDTCSGRRLHR
jgi:hypothetical protein